MNLGQLAPAGLATKELPWQVQNYAKVYFTTLEDDKKEVVTKALNRASGFIRSKLCDVVDLRKMPELSFVYDESISYGKKIEDIIEKINEE